MAVHFAQQLPLPTAGSNAGCSRGTESIAETTETHNRPPPATATPDETRSAHGILGGANDLGGTNGPGGAACAPTCTPLSAGMVPARDDAFEARKRALAPPSTAGYSEGWSNLSSELALMHTVMQTTNVDDEAKHEHEHDDSHNDALVIHEATIWEAPKVAPPNPTAEATSQQLRDEHATVAAGEPGGCRAWSLSPGAVASSGPSEMLGKPRKTAAALRREKRQRAALKDRAARVGEKYEYSVAMETMHRLMSQQVAAHAAHAAHGHSACASPAYGSAGYEEPYGYYQPMHAPSFGPGHYGGGSHYDGSGYQ